MFFEPFSILGMYFLLSLASAGLGKALWGGAFPTLVGYCVLYSPLGGLLVMMKQNGKKKRSQLQEIELYEEKGVQRGD